MLFFRERLAASPMLHRKRRLLAWGSVAGYCALVFFFSSQSDLAVPELFSLLDKLVHLLEYVGLGWLWARAARIEWPGWTTWAVVLSTLAVAVAYGASDEWHQLYVPGRFAEFYDVVADAGGGTLGGIGYLLWLRRRDEDGENGRGGVSETPL